MHSNNYTSFQFWTAIIGLVSSIVTIYGFLTGLVSTNILPAVMQKPIPLSFLSAFAFFYFSVIIIYAIISRHRAHWSHMPTESPPRFHHGQPFGYYFIIVLFIWLPLYLLWSSFVWSINDLSTLGPSSQLNALKNFTLFAAVSTATIWAAFVYLDKYLRDNFAHHQLAIAAGMNTFPSSRA